MTEAERSRRRRDASRTRADLLEAAAELFGQHGYAATTLRAIGDRAGVDPALVARYFGNKENLYLESIISSPVPVDPDGPLGSVALQRMFERAEGARSSPVMWVSLMGTEDDEVRTAVQRVLRERITGPLLERLRERGGSDVDLRAEVAIAVAFGVAMARSAGLFDRLGGAPTADVVELCMAAVDAVVGDHPSD